MNHPHIISATLSGGAWSENVVLHSMECINIIIVPTDVNNTYTFKITSPNDLIVFSALVTGRLYREVKIAFSGTYTLSIAGATISGDAVNGELGFRR